MAIVSSAGTVNYYAHMGKGSSKVRAGDTVTAGQEVGAIGAKADAEGTPTHLHFDELPPPYTSRVSCSDAACAKYPFVNVQPELVAAYNALP